MNDPLFLKTDWAWDRDYPMCHIVKTGDFLWLTGQIAMNEDGELVGKGDLQAQARQVFRNMRRVLGTVGCDLTTVIRLTNYLVTPMTDMEATKKYWEVRKEFFGDHKPASTGVQVAALMLPEMLIEVDAIAYAPYAEVQPGTMILNAPNQSAAK